MDYYLIDLYREGSVLDVNAKVSLDKIDYVCKHKWYLSKTDYPFTFIKGDRVPLHKFIFFLNTGTTVAHYNEKMVIDHINRDRLDARNENLRLATPAENSYNKTNKNLLRNIKQNKKGTYNIKITKNKEIFKINDIETLEEAINLYNIIVEEIYGSFGVKI